MVSHDSNDVCYDVCTVYRAGNQSSTLAGVSVYPLHIHLKYPHVREGWRKRIKKLFRKETDQSKDPQKELQ